MDYLEREELKQDAWNVINSKESPRKKAWAALDLIEAHYWRALEALNALPKPMQRKIYGKRYYPPHQLEIDEYTCHWLASNGERLIPHPVLQALYAEFPCYKPKKHRYLPIGCTIYTLSDSN